MTSDGLYRLTDAVISDMIKVTQSDDLNLRGKVYIIRKYEYIKRQNCYIIITKLSNVQLHVLAAALLVHHNYNYCDLLGFIYHLSSY